MSGLRASSGDIGWGVAGALSLHVAMIALAVLWVVFYSYVVEPGHEPGFYEAHARVSSPVVSVAAGGPLFFLAARFLARRRTAAVAWIAVGVYLLSDLAVITASGSLATRVTLFFLVGALIKIAGAALGIKRARA